MRRSTPVGRAILLFVLLGSQLAFGQALHEGSMTFSECVALVESFEEKGVTEETSTDVLVASQTTWALVSDGQHRGLDLFDRIIFAVRVAGRDRLTATVLGLRPGSPRCRRRDPKPRLWRRDLADPASPKSRSMCVRAPRPRPPRLPTP